MMLSEGASIDAEFLRTIPGKSSCPVAFDASTDWRRAVMSSVETGANSVNAGGICACFDGGHYGVRGARRVWQPPMDGCASLAVVEARVFR